jgi:hypothetical protein
VALKNSFWTGLTYGVQQHIITGRTCQGASYWLTSPPNWEDNFYIDPSPFRLLLKYSLGMPLILSSQRCPDCNTIMDIYGDHAVTCKTASGVIDKHNSIVKSKMKNAGKYVLQL